MIGRLRRFAPALALALLGCAGGPDKGTSEGVSATSSGDATTSDASATSAASSTGDASSSTASSSTASSPTASSSTDGSTGTASASAGSSTTGPTACEAIVGSTECEALAAVSPDLTLDECLLCQGTACGSEPTCDSQYPCVDGVILLQGCCQDAECDGLTPFCGMYIGTNDICVLSDDI